MALNKDVGVTGLRELRAKLKRLDATTRGKALRDSLLEAAEPVRAEAERLTPKSDVPGGTTGRGHAKDHIVKAIDEGASTSDKAVVNVGPEKDFWYLIFSEFGTPHQAATAPFRRAADSRMDEALREFAKDLERRIKVVAK